MTDVYVSRRERLDASSSASLDDERPADVHGALVASRRGARLARIHVARVGHGAALALSLRARWDAPCAVRRMTASPTAERGRVVGHPARSRGVRPGASAHRTRSRRTPATDARGAHVRRAACAMDVRRMQRARVPSRVLTSARDAVLWQAFDAGAPARRFVRQSGGRPGHRGSIARTPLGARVGRRAHHARRAIIGRSWRDAARAARQRAAAPRGVAGPRAARQCAHRGRRRRRSAGTPGGPSRPCGGLLAREARRARVAAACAASARSLRRVVARIAVRAPAGAHPWRPRRERRARPIA